MNTEVERCLLVITQKSWSAYTGFILFNIAANMIRATVAKFSVTNLITQNSTGHQYRHHQNYHQA